MFAHMGLEVTVVVLLRLSACWASPVRHLDRPDLVNWTSVGGDDGQALQRRFEERVYDDVDTIGAEATETDTALKTHFSSASTGYVQTERGPGTPTHSVLLRVPANHSVLLSMLNITVDMDRGCSWFPLSVSIVSREGIITSWEPCRGKRLYTDAFEASEVNVTLEPHSVGDAPISFKLVFSYIQTGELAGLRGSGAWNCSSPLYPRLHPHVTCNGRRDCASGADEVGCDYESQSCGAGRIAAGDSCYLLLDPPVDGRALSLDEASKRCRHQGGYLPSLNAPEEWRTFSKLLSQRLVFRWLFLGLRYRRATQSHQYRKVPFWDDGTVAYFRHAEEFGNPTQSVVMYWRYSNDARSFVGLLQTYDPGYMAVLCEVPAITSSSPGNNDNNNSNNNYNNNTYNNNYNNNNYNNNNYNNNNNNNNSESEKAQPTFPTIPNITVDITRDFPIPVYQCPEGHVTHAFLACDVKASCWGRGYGPDYRCDAALTPLPPQFSCDNGYEAVPFTLICDFRSDCGDESDENFCVFPPCDTDWLECGGGQCFLSGGLCDLTLDCVNGQDEAHCSMRGMHPPFHLPAAVSLDQGGHLTVEAVFPCPSSTFRCSASILLCLSLDLRCNGVADCPGREDEAGCHGYACPGLYRCRGASICLHPSSLCDASRQCPEGDDELLCEKEGGGAFQCPRPCTCRGLSVICPAGHAFASLPRLLFSFLRGDDYEDDDDDGSSSSSSSSSSLRYVEAAGSGVGPRDVRGHRLLVHLGLARCRLTSLNADDVTLPNLLALDLRDNLLTALTAAALPLLTRLRQLWLGGNPLATTFIRLTPTTPSPIPSSSPSENGGGADLSQRRFESLMLLDLSGSRWARVDAAQLAVFPNLRTLNLSGSGVVSVSARGWTVLPRLASLDVTGGQLHSFPRDMFRGMEELAEVRSDNYKVCCSANLPAGFNPAHCHAPRDALSSCDALLGSDAHRVALATFAAFAVAGNAGSLLYRLALSDAGPSALGFGVLVTHLSFADLLMGVYLAVIGVADRVYLGEYLWEDATWRRHWACSAAGFLSFLSSEVSAFLVSLITLDRFLVLRYPFSRYHLTQVSARLACLVAWTLGVTLAGVPFLPPLAHWRFYQQSGICIPLPVTAKAFPGKVYASSVLIGLNFLIFVVIAIGQTSIYLTVTAARMPSVFADRGRTEAQVRSRSKDFALARRLVAVAVSDFLCWFPIGLLGILAAAGTPIPGQVNVAVAILVLPVNSALNPFLYTLNTIRERRDRVREKRLLARLREAAPKTRPQTTPISPLVQ